MRVLNCYSAVSVECRVRDSFLPEALGLSATSGGFAAVGVEDLGLSRIWVVPGDWADVDLDCRQFLRDLGLSAWSLGAVGESEGRVVCGAAGRLILV